MSKAVDRYLLHSAEAMSVVAADGGRIIVSPESYDSLCEESAALSGLHLPNCESGELLCSKRRRERWQALATGATGTRAIASKAEGDE